ncbi:MAG: restriction endonuclease subunit S [Lachnospiraceae bacterium]|jgi:type I restriction enzyme S subunit|nr:restriction endonuclease subunit S [Lachnospiraceae bacterium]
MANTPNIRFKGYTDDWEQRKLGDMVSFSKGSGYSKGDLKENGTPIILYGRLYTKYETIISEVDTFVDEKKGSVYSKGGEVIVPASGETAEDISIASVVEKSGVLLGGDLNVITPPEDMDSAFLAISISNGKPHNDMAKMAQGKSVVHLHNSDLAKIDLPYPSYDEQRRISGFFYDLDNLITLHQRKCEQTKQLKKYMLQKMFPKNGGSVPEIRFSGFTDDWEQRKVGDFLSESREIGHKGDIAQKITVKLWGKGVFKKDDAGSSNTQYFIRHANQFIYSKLDFLNCAFGVVPDELEGLETTADVPAFDCDGINPKFLYYIAIQPSFYLKNGMIADGSRKAKRIHADAFLEMPLCVPTIEEQEKIVNYFDSLDNLITLHLRKCNELKEVKKYMLQNMFPKA